MSPRIKSLEKKTFSWSKALIKLKQPHMHLNFPLSMGKQQTQEFCWARGNTMSTQLPHSLGVGDKYPFKMTGILIKQTLQFVRASKCKFSVSSHAII